LLLALPSLEIPGDPAKWLDLPFEMRTRAVRCQRHDEGPEPFDGSSIGATGGLSSNRIGG
jgi:hypothetical protein